MNSHRKYTSLLRPSLLILILALCFKTGVRVDAARSVVKEAAKSIFMFSGKVIDEKGKGIGGVVVNNGVDFIRTAKDGSWKLKTDTVRSKFVSISTPADCEINAYAGVAGGFFVPVRKLAATRRHNFRLKRRKVLADKFCYVAISDPQLANEHDLRRWLGESVPDMKSTVDSVAGGRTVVGVALGDIVFDNMPIYKEYVESVPRLGFTLFHCIGNHDFDRHYKALDKRPAGSADYAEMEFNRWFGPASYSFNIGRVHVVTLKNIDYDGGGHFTERLPEDQLEWLRHDLSFVPKGTTVFLNMHAAAWNTVHNRGNIRNADVLKDILNGYNVHVFCGHTHFYQNIVVSPTLYQHNIGAVCGAWWSCDVNRCGAPNGYLIVDVDGTDVRWHYKATAHPFSYQLRLYPVGTYKDEDGCFVANVWDWDKDCSVVWYQDGRLMGKMERFTGSDETFASTLKDRSEAVPTGHLFKARPSAGRHTLKVVFTNRFGEKYTATLDK